jgi:malonyl-CoA/methylmalonyl-CoA synthetase
VPVNIQYRKVELRHIFDDADVRLCFTDKERRPELERVRGDLPDLESVIEVGGELEDFLDTAADHESALPSGEDLAVIAYTSGTTGRSKGAMLLHRNLVANAEAVCSAWRWSTDDVLLLTLPLFHTHGLMVGAHGTFFTGASAELHRKFDAAAVYEALLEGRVTMFFGVPTMYARLLREAEGRAERPRPLRLYVSGSAPLSPQARSAKSRFAAHTSSPGTGMGPTPPRRASIMTAGSRRGISASSARMGTSRSLAGRRS